MDVVNFYAQVKEDISNGQYEKLKEYKFEKPEFFNWVRDIFEPFNVEKSPDKEALIWKNPKDVKHYSFKELSEKSNQLLNFLRKNGVAQNDKIYFQIPLSEHNWLGYLSCIKGGFIIAPAATTLPPKEIAFRFSSVFPKVVFADDENAEKIEKAEEELGKSIDVKVVTDTPRDGWIFFDDIYKESKEAEAAQTRPDDPLFYFFTSGTTGMPKIVTHTHFTYPIGHLTTASWLGLKSDDVHYNISQPGWAKFSWSSFFAPWAMGATIFANQVDRFEPLDQLKTIEEYKITTFCSPPTVLRMFIREDLKNYNFSLRECVAAGEPLNPEIIEKWKEGTGILIRDGYGQTESTAMVGNLPNSKVKYGSMGKETFLYHIVIADEDGNILPDLEEGNICVKMDENTVNGIFKDYEGNSELKGRVFKNGLYYTGDKAYRDEDGYLWFIGRDDDVIKASDFRIGPFEVESALIEHEAIVEAAVVASPHHLRGYAVKAFVSLGKGYEASEKLAREIFTFSEEHLATYKIPRIIEFVEDFPKTISGKIRRVELRSQEALDKQKSIRKHLEFFHEKY